jgi:hypothetical protein
VLLDEVQAKRGDCRPSEHQWGNKIHDMRGWAGMKHYTAQKDKRKMQVVGLSLFKERTRLL